MNFRDRTAAILGAACNQCDLLVKVLAVQDRPRFEAKGACRNQLKQFNTDNCNSVPATVNRQIHYRKMSNSFNTEIRQMDYPMM